MIRVSLSMLFAGLISLSFSGCSWCTEIEYRDRNVPFEVKVPVACSVPETNCTIEGTDTEVVVKLVECIVDLREAAKVCQ